MNKLRVNVPSILEVEPKKKLSISLNISRKSTDINGSVVPDNTLPASMQVNYPVHFFGQFDRESGYRIADQALSKENNTKLFAVYVWGLNSPLFFFNPLSDVNKFFQKGDLIFVYVDDLLLPNYFTFVIVNSVDGNYASICSETKTNQLSSENWGAFKIFEIQETWQDDQQLEQLFYFVQPKLDARFQIDSKSPIDYYNPEIVKQKKVVIPIEAVVNQYFGLSTFIAFNNPLLNVNFIIYV